MEKKNNIKSPVNGKNYRAIDELTEIIKAGGTVGPEEMRGLSEEEVSKLTEAILMADQGLTNLADADAPAGNPNFYGDRSKDPLFRIKKNEGKTLSDKKLKFLLDESIKNPFPAQVFPIEIQDIIKSTNESLNFPVDFIGSAMIYASSVAIGKTHLIKVRDGGWYEPPKVYLAVVGRAGTNKTHPFSFALKPIADRDIKEYRLYQKDMRQYKEDLNAGNKKEGVPKPIWRQCIVRNYTEESLPKNIECNPKGVGIYSDELAGWFGNFNKYNSGSEEPFWLSVWSNQDVSINRSGSDPILLDEPFISVAGSIQNGVLSKLTKGRKDSGFIDRILFSIPDQLKRKAWSDHDLSESVTEDWKSILMELLNLGFNQNEEGYDEPYILEFTPDAKKEFRGYVELLVSMDELPEGMRLSGLFAKFETYTARFALMIQMMKYACHGGGKEFVDLDSVKSAIKLAEYFMKNYIKVEGIVSTPPDPLENLTVKYRNFYEALPDEFETAEARFIGAEMKYEVKAESVKKFLTRKDLFTKIKKGSYLKDL